MEIGGQKVFEARGLEILHVLVVGLKEIFRVTNIC